MEERVSSVEAGLRAARMQRFGLVPGGSAPSEVQVVEPAASSALSAPSNGRSGARASAAGSEVGQPMARARVSAGGRWFDDGSESPGRPAHKRRRGSDLIAADETTSGGSMMESTAGARKPVPRAGKGKTIDLTADSPHSGGLLRRANARVVSGGPSFSAVAARKRKSTDQSVVIIEDDDEYRSDSPTDTSSSRDLRRDLRAQARRSAVALSPYERRESLASGAGGERMSRRSTSVVLLDDVASSPPSRNSERDGMRSRRRQDAHVDGVSGSSQSHAMTGALGKQSASADSDDELVATNSMKQGDFDPAQEAAAHALGALNDKLQISSTVSRAFSCPVCFDDIDKGGHVAIFSCGHRLCFTCSSHFVGDKVSGAQVSRKQLICPIPDCKTALTGQEVRGCLADQPQLLAKYSSFTLQNYLRKEAWAPTFFCPSPGCEFAAEKAKDQVQERFECPSCRTCYCLKCDTRWHGKDTCEEAEEKKNMTPEERKFRAMAAKKGMKKCPQCKMWVDKKSGCDAMVCVCGCTFCWRCGEDVNKKGGCLCLQNLEHLSAKEKDIVIQVNAHSTNRDNPAHAHFQNNLHQENFGMLGGLGAGLGRGMGRGFMQQLNNLFGPGWDMGGGGGRGHRLGERGGGGHRLGGRGGRVG